MKNAFLDTNVIIAMIFLINSHHLKAKQVFNSYHHYYWSNSVVKEFNRRFGEKQINLKIFFEDLKLFMENPEKDLYSDVDLLIFLKKHYSEKLFEDSKNSIKPFWNHYIGVESMIPFLNMKKSINFCLNDLMITSVKNKEKLENKLILAPQRENDYSVIDAMLESFGVHYEDRSVILDGHDFACFSSQPVDFVTFDEDCFNGAKNVGRLCFNSVKGRFDFKAS
ncbi:MAG: hypothetical protein E7Z79_08450 [Methanobrevibacter thaueri]|uniref:Uncharacterized protein n=1 Tax=Methanobrevibacter thaueri TaxID=190975 RepID=A0A8T3V789_9EURY|nr:hypothetical protein [Methanobrevibacter thaueri]MBE6502453.1 hypothetical protein [Methanobrevibacter thaueri]